MTNKEINRASRFYFEKSKNIYDVGYCREFKLPVGIRPIHNFIKPAVNTLTALSLQENIEIKIKDLENFTISNVLDFNRFQSKKYDVMIDLIVYGEALLFAEKTIDNNVIINKIQPGTFEYEKSNGKIISLKVSGYNMVISSSGQVEKLETKKHYFLQDATYYVKDESSGSIELVGAFLPFALFETNYEIDGMIDIVDNLNVFQYCLNNIGVMHGNAILHFMAQAGTINKSAKTETNKGYTIFESENEIKFVEMSGNIASIIMQDKDKLLALLAKQYSECDISTMASGSNVSEATTLIKFTDITSKVNGLRSEFTTGMIELINIIFLTLSLPTPENVTIEFEPILPEVANFSNENLILTILTGYKALGNEKLLNEFRDRSKLSKIENKDFEELRNAL